MEILTIKSFDELLSKISSFRHPYQQLQFRGETCDDCNWTLEPSGARGISTANDLIQKEKWYLDEFIKRLEEKDLSYRILEKDNPHLFQRNWERVTQAQHYGLPTRLMDWSLDQHRGIYFAVDDPKMDEHDGRLWIYKCPETLIYGDTHDNPGSDYNRFDPFAINESIIVNPGYFYSPNRQDYIGNERRWKQMGRFLVQSSRDSIIPMEDNSFFSEDLVKIIIPISIKRAIRDEYHKRGLTKEFLYGEKDPEIDTIIADLKRYKETT